MPLYEPPSWAGFLDRRKYGIDFHSPITHFDIQYTDPAKSHMKVTPITVLHHRRGRPDIAGSSRVVL